MLSLLVAITQTSDPSSDPRLSHPVTVEERYLPLSDFAARLTKVTKVPIKVSGDMMPRKLTLFVEARTAHETMKMVANALGGRWVRIGEDWNLRADQDLARAEAQAEAARSSWLREESLAWVRAFRASPKSQAPSIEERAAALLAKMGESRAADLLVAGRPLVATTGGLYGTTPLSLTGALGEAAAEIPKEPALFLFRNSVDGVARLEFVDLASTTRVQRSVAPKERPKPPSDDKVTKLEDDWAVDDDSNVSQTPLKSLPDDPDPYGMSWISLADVLKRIHDRTDLPVAAEAFRACSCSQSGWMMPTVAETMRRVQADLGGKMVGSAPIVWRTEKGWLLARPRSAWELRKGEIPESSLVPLEKKPPTLDGLAALAGSLTDPQAQAIGVRRPLAAFPTIALYTGYRALAIYDALTPELRKRIFEGVPYAEMPALARQRWDAVPLRVWISAGGPTIAAILSGRRPALAGLRLEPNEGSYAVGQPGNVDTKYSSVVFRLGLSGEAPSYTVPLAVEKG
jgi:hypothetical protein